MLFKTVSDLECLILWLGKLFHNVGEATQTHSIHMSSTYTNSDGKNQFTGWSECSGVHLLVNQFTGWSECSGVHLLVNQFTGWSECSGVHLLVNQFTGWSECSGVHLLVNQFYQIFPVPDHLVPCMWSWASWIGSAPLPLFTGSQCTPSDQPSGDILDTLQLLDQSV